MNFKFSGFLIISILAFSANAQSTYVTGRVISEDLESLPQVTIHNCDTVLLAKTDIDGYFEFQLPLESEKLLLGWIGFEWTWIELVKSCNDLEVIMMYDVIYDFIPLKKANKKRYKRFKSLSDLHLQAYKEGLFKNETTCIEYQFYPY